MTQGMIAIVQTVNNKESVRFLEKHLGKNNCRVIFVETTKDDDMVSCISQSLHGITAVLIPVTIADLSYIRTQLCYRSSPLTSPLICLGFGVSSAVFEDLMRYGIADFIQDGTQVNEIKVRLKVLKYRGVFLGPGYENTSQRLSYHVQSKTIETQVESSQSLHLKDSLSYHQSQDFYDVLCREHDYNSAKRQMIECFDRGYLSAMLSWQRGNISQAAIHAGKNRRAFWELMRKYQIDGQAYRELS
ncbi:hypothetical protein [Basilea psittacipulmonis]|uniref:DNA binding HTH domain-containing protein n=1 Tax=Basilea psittacipulmonis DSM 24701 TaxID=1072685 RepID=A0A077DFQ8_9BURK|nr:hypothetical protein [Basilea psittacipulmonis]AIL32187.1 hypothetical protein IX83_01640 [Basilea psittacipulmonis DSM 24701]